ncbi:MAG: hypothetical protein V4674_03800 [Patescibacteria group bacterium]
MRKERRTPYESHAAHLREQGERGREKGNTAERMFIAAWHNYRWKPRWLVEVRPGTRYEDEREKTDAVILTAIGVPIRIQIKARRISAVREEMFFRMGIVPVGVLPRYTPDEVRIQTLLAIDRYYRFRETSLPRTRRAGNNVSSAHR